jgi:3-deoxy-D-manno-octulosonate 8-phosphate phosphatase (KDO 8-P phosphatase)
MDSKRWRRCMEVVERAKRVKIFIMDVDGVMTNGGMIIGNGGEEFKIFNARDGMGVELLHYAGIIPCIITRERTSIVERRAKKLKISELHQGVKDKAHILNLLLRKYGVTLEEVAFIGDDINDIPILKRVGLAICVRDAVDEVKEVADYVTNYPGGGGAIREAAKLILEAKGILRDVISKYIEDLGEK